MVSDSPKIFILEKTIGISLSSLLCFRGVFHTVFLVTTNRQEIGTTEEGPSCEHLDHNLQSEASIKAAERWFGNYEIFWKWNRQLVYFHLICKSSWETQVYSILPLAIIELINRIGGALCMIMTVVGWKTKCKWNLTQRENRAHWRRGGKRCWQLNIKQWHTIYAYSLPGHLCAKHCYSMGQLFIDW